MYVTGKLLVWSLGGVLSKNASRTGTISIHLISWAFACPIVDGVCLLVSVRMCGWCSLWVPLFLLVPPLFILVVYFVPGGA